MRAPRPAPVLALALAAALPAAAGDWPQIRGPGRDGVASDPGPIARWDQAPPAVAWRRAIGSGFSGVAVAGDRAFTLESEGGREHVVAFDPATGERRWRTAIGTTFPSEFGDGPRATPTLDGDRLFAISADMQLAALDQRDGRVLWRADLQGGLGGPQPRFGYASSPLVAGDLLVVEAGSAPPPPPEGAVAGGAAAGGAPADTPPAEAPETAVVAFDKATGEPRWKALGGPAGYASPVLAEIDGVPQLVFFRRVGPEAVALGLDGRVLWRHPGAPTALTMALPLAGGRLFIASIDDDFGGKLLRIRRDGEAWRVEELWQNRLMRNHFNASVAVGDGLFGFDNSTLRCLDLETGETRWARRGFGKGSLLAAGDLLFVLGDDGVVAEVEARCDAYRELGRLQASEGKAWTPPSLAGGRLFVRDLDELVAIDVRAKDAGEAQNPTTGATP